MEDVIAKLKRLKKQIEIMPDNYQKTLLVTNYFRLYSFLVDSKKISGDDEEYFLETEISDFIKKISKSITNHINDLINNNKRLLNLDLELVRVYFEGNWNKRKIRKTISSKKAEQLLENFLKSLGTDVFRLYTELKNNNICNLSTNIIDTDGACYGMIGTKHSYINVKNNDNNLSGYIALSHELGHAYHFYLLRNHGNASISNMNICLEVMSLLFEKLFIKFLESSYDYNDDTSSLWYDYYHSHFWILMDLLVTSYLLDKNKIGYIDNSLNCQANCSDTEVYALAESLGYISDVYPDLNLGNYNYLISNIISDYFLKSMEFDFSKGFREACNFVQEASLYTIEEILDKYTSDLSYTKEGIRMAIKKGRTYRKAKR